jgi:hypothetical protein
LGTVYDRSGDGALRQGEILTNVILARPTVESVGTEELEIDEETHPYAVVLNQDCDLDQDWRVRSAPQQPPDANAERRLIPSILFAQVTTAADLRARITEGGAVWRRITQNKDERYQFLEAVPADDDAAAEGLAALGIDFKRHFAISTAEIYRRIARGEARRRCRLKNPYLEHLSTRFCYYQFRVALPVDHQGG